MVAVDLRGHGQTVTDDDSDLSADTQSGDICRVAEKIASTSPASPVVLIGHSMGGAMAVRAAQRGGIQGLAGVCVIDVVEGTAMDALSAMHGFLRGRPDKFRSLESAIEWSLKSGQVRNADSARVSMPGQLRVAEDGGECAAARVGEEGASDEKKAGDEEVAVVTAPAADAIAEEDDEGSQEISGAARRHVLL